MTEDTPQRSHPLHQVFNGLRWIARAVAPWRMMPHDLPPWQVVYQQTQRWISAGVFESLVHDLRELPRVAAGRQARPSAAVFDSRTLQSSPASGARSGYDGAKRRKGSKTHIAVDTLGHLLALIVTPADEQDRAQVAALAEAVQGVTGESVELGLRRPRLCGRGRGGVGRRARPAARSREVAGGQARVRAAAAPLGRRA